MSGTIVMIEKKSEALMSETLCGKGGIFILYLDEIDICDCVYIICATTIHWSLIYLFINTFKLYIFTNTFIQFLFYLNFSRNVYL